MLTSLVLAGLLSLSAPQAQDQQPATALPDVEVHARPTPEAVREFVESVAAPAKGRGLARWEKEVCPGVVNLEKSAAQAIIDRIVTVAADLNLPTGESGCDPNLVIIFTDDGSGVAAALYERDRRLFRQNVSGLDQGVAAFRTFLSSDRPVRWWSLSIPIDSETGQRAHRAPGDLAIEQLPADLAGALGCSSSDCPIIYAPIIVSTGASRLNSQVVDHLYKTIVVVDTDHVGSVHTGQLGDYLALVGLAQVDADADVRGFDTILNLFAGGDQQELTAWDRSYLGALYGSRSMLRSPRAQASDVVGIMTRGQKAIQRDQQLEGGPR